MMGVDGVCWLIDGVGGCVHARISLVSDPPPNPVVVFVWMMPCIQPTVGHYQLAIAACKHADHKVCVKRWPASWVGWQDL